MDQAIHYLVLKKFQTVGSFYDVGISSSKIQIFKCSALSNDIFCVQVNQIRFKCYKMPFYNSLIDDSSDEDEPEVNEYIIATWILFAGKQADTRIIKYKSLYISGLIKVLETSIYMSQKNMKNRPQRAIHKPRRYKTTSSEEADSRKKTMVEPPPNGLLEKDVIELRDILENHSPDMRAQNNSFTYEHSFIDHTKHVSDTSHASDTTHLQTYTQPLTVSHTTQAFCSSVASHSQTYTQPLTVSHTTQAFCSSVASHSQTYTQPLTVSHTTQAFCSSVPSHSQTYTQPLTVNHTTQKLCSTVTSHLQAYKQPLSVTYTTQDLPMHNNSQLLSHAQQNLHLNHTTQPFTHEPRTSVATYTQHVDNRLNTPHDEDIQSIHGIMDLLVAEIQCKLWLKNCGRTIEVPTENLYKTYRVCGNHFDSTMFLNDLKNRLQSHAVPKLAINLNIENENMVLKYITLETQVHNSSLISDTQLYSPCNVTDQDVNIIIDQDDQDNRRNQEVQTEQSSIRQEKKIKTDRILSIHSPRKTKLKKKIHLLQRKLRKVKEQLKQRKQVIQRTVRSSLCQNIVMQQINYYHRLLRLL
ncbi:uncharacterized protein LOC118645881 isoform X3 [Monomorium pharaonis]|uniref:uncharacterized protein LOC118645881 isoform X3 n=1 Tax=Monomorium pharaonis TaxID=307658 RepID=UPI001745F7FA|nr:uncharacterized protein LOC118645881 isoform X3 [Monomorium pharaonis]